MMLFRLAVLKSTALGAAGMAGVILAASSAQASLMCARNVADWKSENLNACDAVTAGKPPCSR